jgi:hypothetical protein
VHLVNLEEQFEGDGVVVVEVVQDATSAATLESWSLGYDYNLFRTDPATMMQTDYGASFLGYPTFALVDLETMEVLVSDCYGDGTPASWAACIEQHL